MNKKGMTAQRFPGPWELRLTPPKETKCDGCLSPQAITAEGLGLKITDDVPEGLRQIDQERLHRAQVEADAKRTFKTRKAWRSHNKSEHSGKAHPLV